MGAMDSAVAFTAALAITAVGGIVAHRMMRVSTSAAVPRPVVDGQALRRTHERRAETYTEFSTTAGQIAATVMLWPHLPQAARPHALDQARAHLQKLCAQHAAVLADSDTGIRDAAAAVVADSERLVDALVLDADPGPEELRLAAAQDLTLPFLRACREYLEAESERHFGLRPAAGRSLFGRLSPR
jgi:hypothetical protein